MIDFLGDFGVFCIYILWKVYDVYRLVNLDFSYVRLSEYLSFFMGVWNL